MDNVEEYMLRVLRRTQLQLEENLTPEQISKFNAMLEKVEQAPSLENEISLFKKVKGFQQTALTMEWIVKRVHYTGEEFSLEQFENDINLVNEKFFQSFVNESTISIPSHQKDEVFEQGFTVEEKEIFEPVIEQKIEPQEKIQKQESTQEDSPYFATQKKDIPLPQSSIPIPTGASNSPSLIVFLEPQLVLSFQRFTDTMQKIGDKSPIERKAIYPLLKAIAKSSIDFARVKNKTLVVEFLQMVIEFLTTLDAVGTIREKEVTVAIKDFGNRLSIAMNSQSGGEEHLQTLNEFLRTSNNSLKL